MEVVAERIAEAGYRPGLWLAPFVARSNSQVFGEHPELFIRHPDGRPVVAGVNWAGPFHGLDLAQPEAQDLVRDTITRVRQWGFSYLKLDFVYGGALGEPRANGMTGEEAYRRGIEVVREAAGEDAYLLGCGAPVVASLGVFDGMRIGPDVALHWEIPSQPQTDHTFGEPASRHALSTSLNRLWLDRAVAVDPDVVFFRSRCMQLDARQRGYLQDLATICRFVATSDPPQWLQPDEMLALSDYLDERPEVRRLGRYRFSVDGREVDFSPIVLDDPEAVDLELTTVGR
jgi:alpha-galactosidase